MENSEILYILAKANRECGYDSYADILQKVAMTERRKEADKDLLIMEAELISNSSLT